MKDKTIRAKLIGELYDLILSLQTIEDCEKLFADLCTDKELEQMAQRVRAARMLMDGKTYMEVIKETEISSATLSRVSRCVQYGEGYQNFIK